MADDFSHRREAARWRKLPARTRRWRPLAFEVLETRLTLSTYYVTNTSDDLNPGSLRYAITQANANPGLDTITNVFPIDDNTVQVISGTITLGGTPLPTITDDVAIQGSGLTVSGANTTFIFDISHGNVSIHGLSLTNGKSAVGVGAVLNESGNLTLSNLTVSNSEGNTLGAISNQGTLTLNAVTVSNNVAANSAAGITNLGTLNILNSTISGNQGYIGGILNLGTLTISGSTISGNQGKIGGAIYAGSIGAGSVSISNTTISGNTARASDILARGGAIFEQGGTVTLDHVTLTGNSAWGGNGIPGGNGQIAQGGAVYIAGGVMDVRDSNVVSNTARGGDGGAGSGGGTGSTGATGFSDSPTGGTGGIGGTGGNGGAGSAGTGGGIYLASGQLRLLNSTVANNTAQGGTGGTGGDGGLGGQGGAGWDPPMGGLGNPVIFPGGPGGVGGVGGTGGAGGAGGNVAGGGIFVASGNVNLSNATIADNELIAGNAGRGGAGGRGGTGGRGGASPIGGGVGGNGGRGGTGGNGGTGGSAAGGGVNIPGSSTTMTNVTLAYNQIAFGVLGGAGGAGTGGAGGSGLQGKPNGTTGSGGSGGSSGVNGTASGGGILTSPGITQINNTIVAGNTGPNAAASDIAGGGVVVGSNNLIGTGGSGGLVNHSDGNLVGVSNPRLGSLANNGGPTQTIALLQGSLAYNTGRNDFALDPLGNALTTDQRGGSFPRVIDGTVDIGAFEAPRESLIVTTLVDEDNGASDPGLGTGTSLREAISLANIRTGASEITFAASLRFGTIALGGTELLITGDATITGIGGTLGNPVGITIDGGGVSRVLEIATGANVNLSNLEITNGYTNTNGGGILNNGTLRLADSIVTGNTAPGDRSYGGGIDNRGTLTLYESTISNNTSDFGAGINSKGPLTIEFSTLSANTARRAGGAVLIDGPPIGNAVEFLMVDSTLSGNQTTHGEGGGAIYSFNGALHIYSSTISNNSDTGRNYGGIYARGGSLFATNSIISGNRGYDVYVRNFDNPSVLDPSSGYNVVGTANAAPLSNGANHNIVATDPLLGPLQNNGGFTLTQMPLPTSPAIDAGDPLFHDGSAYDQRNNRFPSFQFRTVQVTPHSTNDYVGLAEVKFGATSGAVITPTSVFASSYYDAAHLPTNLIDSSGLDTSSGNVLTYTHAADPSANGMWHAGAGQGTGGDAPNVVAQYVVFDLGANYSLSTAYLWQMVQTDLLGRGIKGFKLYTSPNAPNPADATNPPTNYNHNGFTFVLQGELDPGPTSGSAPTQAFTLSSATNVRQIYLEIDSDYNTAPRIDIGAIERQSFALRGDYNLNDVVDAADYVVWRKTLGSTTDLRADGSGPQGVPDGVVDQIDNDFWRTRFGRTTSVALGAGASDSNLVGASAAIGSASNTSQAVSINIAVAPSGSQDSFATVEQVPATSDTLTATTINPFTFSPAYPSSLGLSLSFTPKTELIRGFATASTQDLLLIELAISQTNSGGTSNSRAETCADKAESDATEPTTAHVDDYFSSLGADPTTIADFSWRSLDDRRQS